MPTSTPVPIISHHSSRASSSTVRSLQPIEPPRTVSLGLRRSIGNDDDDDETSTAASSPPSASSPSNSSDALSQSLDSGGGVDASSPSHASRLTLSLQKLALSTASPPHTSASSLSNLLDPSLSSPTHSSVSASPLDSSPLASTLLSEQLLTLYEQTLHKLFLLRSTERLLSSQSGQLLKALQAEESLLLTLNGTLKRVRHEHKKLLSRILAPRWEVRHHYHMTCMEHSLGHRQPHVMDVAEMLPGHLRLYAIARCHAIVKRTMTSGVMRAKTERNSAADQIKEGYRQLRETRSEMKELTRLVEAMQAKTHLLSSDEEKQRLDAIIRKHKRQLSTISSSASAKQAIKGVLGAGSRGIGSRMGDGPAGWAGASSGMSVGREITLASPTNASSIRMRYLKSLNMAPRPYDARGGEGAEVVNKEEKKRVAESYNNDWKVMMHLFHKLEQQRKRQQDTQGESKDDSSLTSFSPSPSPLPPTPLSAAETHAVSDDEFAVPDGTEGELRIVQSYRKRMGLQTLPQPLSFEDSETAVRDSLDPNDAVVSEKDENEAAVNRVMALGREMAEPASPVQVPYSPGPASPGSMTPPGESTVPGSPIGSPGPGASGRRASSGLGMALGRERRASERNDSERKEERGDDRKVKR